MVREFKPGFRLSKTDVVVLVIGGALTAMLAFVQPSLAFAIGFVVVHFFLFCNVFRVGRALELLWAAWFIALAGPTMIFDWPGWLAVAFLSGLATVGVLVLQARKPCYHGVGWQVINPKLREWWETQSQTPT